MRARRFELFVALRYLRGSAHGFSPVIVGFLTLAVALVAAGTVAGLRGESLGLWRTVDTFGGPGALLHSTLTSGALVLWAGLTVVLVVFIGIAAGFVVARRQPAWWLLVVAAGAALAPTVLALAYHLAVHQLGLAFFSNGEVGRLALRILGMLVGASGAAAGLFVGLLILRRLFSFYTTVSITGVWIGTMALVVAVAFMSGLQRDRRAKLLGVNAHIQVSSKDGAISDWEALLTRVRAVPNVRAVSPFAVTDVIVASGNPTAVMLRGIAPDMALDVMQTMRFTEDGETPVTATEAAMRLAPLAMVGPADANPAPPTAAPRNDVDPAPSDMPDMAAPYDLSGTAKEAEKTDAAADDFAAPDDAPIDYSGAPTTGRAVRIDDGATERPLTRRAQALPGLWLGTSLNKTTHLAVGQEVRIVSPLTDPSNPDPSGMAIPFYRDFRVAALFNTEEIEFDSTVIFVSLDEFWRFFDRADDIDGLDVRAQKLEQVEALAVHLGNELGPAYRVTTWQDSNRSLFSAFELEKIALACVLAIIILVASFSIVATLVLVIIEKRREIGLLKTMGASDRGVVKVFVAQGVLIGISGTLLGLAYGLLACWAFVQYPIPVNAEVYFMSTLPVHVEPINIVIIALVGPLVSAAATLYPAWASAKVRPADALRW